jgi:hypothetical protein
MVPPANNTLGRASMTAGSNRSFMKIPRSINTQHCTVIRRAPFSYRSPDCVNNKATAALVIFPGNLEVRRRYSEFASLRQTLVNLHPTLVVPPIPEKHSMNRRNDQGGMQIDQSLSQRCKLGISTAHFQVLSTHYAAKPTRAKDDMAIIDLRKRMLSVFLNRCRRMKRLRNTLSIRFRRSIMAISSLALVGLAA